MGNKVTKLIFKRRSDNFEENGQNVEQFHQNPLENHLIMKIVAGHTFSFAKKEDLSNFRLVNKLWNEIFTEEWRSYYAVLRIHSGLSLKGKKGIYLREMFMSSGTSIKKMNPDFANMPFRMNHFVDWVTLPPPSETSIEGLYWTLYGSNLLSLEFSKLFLPKGKEIKSLKVIFCSCPNLRRLTMAAYTHRNEDDDEETAELGEAFVAQSVQKVIIGNSPYQKPFKKYGMQCFNLFRDCPVLFGKFLKLVPNLKSLVIFPNLGSALNGMTVSVNETLLENENEKYVELYEIIALEVVDLLPLWRYVETVIPPLKRLDLRLSVSGSNLEVFRRIVNWIGDTLQVLKLKLHLDAVLDPSMSYFDTLTGIHLPQLGILDIDCHYSYSDCPYYAFDFRTMRTTPKLKYFHYKSSGNKNMSWKRQSIDWKDLNGGPGWELSENPTPEEFGDALRLEHLDSIWFDRNFNNDLFIELFTIWFPKLDFISTPAKCITR